MDDKTIFELAKQFRKAIENARFEGLFDRDDSFSYFPKRCCGDTCYLLAEYLSSKEQASIYVCGEDDSGQSHAWLVMKDERVRMPSPILFDIPDNIKNVLNVYSDGTYFEPNDVSYYTEGDVINGLIVDITADQFGRNSVYVGYICEFYKRFVFQSASDNINLSNDRLNRLYQIILDNID